MEPGVSTLKPVLCLLNLILLAAATVFGCIAINIIITYYQYESFLKSGHILQIGVIMLAVAGLRLFIGLVSCICAMEDSEHDLQYFTFMRCIVYAVILIQLILPASYKDKVSPEIQENMNCLFEEYDGKTTESSAVDIIQQKLLCCGIQNYTSWENTAWFLANHAVPVSCCKKNETDCQGKLDALNKINTEGCEDKLASLILMNLELLMKVVYVFLLTEAIILLCLFINWCRNKRREYETL